MHQICWLSSQHPQRSLWVKHDTLPGLGLTGVQVHLHVDHKASIMDKMTLHGSPWCQRPQCTATNLPAMRLLLQRSLLHCGAAPCCRAVEGLLNEGIDAQAVRCDVSSKEQVGPGQL